MRKHYPQKKVSVYLPLYPYTIIPASRPLYEGLSTAGVTRRPLTEKKHTCDNRPSELNDSEPENHGTKAVCLATQEAQPAPAQQNFPDLLSGKSLDDLTPERSKKKPAAQPAVFAAQPAVSSSHSPRARAQHLHQPRLPCVQQPRKGLWRSWKHSKIG